MHCETGTRLFVVGQLTRSPYSEPSSQREGKRFFVGRRFRVKPHRWHRYRLQVVGGFPPPSPVTFLRSRSATNEIRREFRGDSRARPAACVARDPRVNVAYTCAHETHVPGPRVWRTTSAGRQKRKSNLLHLVFYPYSKFRQPAGPATCEHIRAFV